MLFIANELPPIKQPWFVGLVGVNSSIDTVVALRRGYSSELLQELKASGCRSVTPEPLKDAKGNVWWFSYLIVRPTLRTFKVLNSWNLTADNRVDIAYDFTFATSIQADQFKDWCAAHGILKWKNKTTSRNWYFGTKGETLYWLDTRDKNKPRRTLAMYTQFRENHDRTIRLELRFQNKHAVQANGLTDLAANPRWIKSINPRELLAKHVSFREINPRFMASKVRQALRRHDRKPITRTSLQWRDRLPGRIRGVYDRVVRYSPKHELPTVTLDVAGLIAVVPECVTIG